MDTFKKRQKEMQRLERQREKAARRLARKEKRALGEDPLAENDNPEGALEGPALDGRDAALEEPKPAPGSGLPG